MARIDWSLFVFVIATLLPQASASFGFTNPSFDYLQLSTAVQLAWNGQQGDVTLRALVYPADEAQSYLPIAANVSGGSYTWMPTALASGSKWTITGTDSEGNIASSNFFTVQSAAGANPVMSQTTATLSQLNPQSIAQSTFATSTVKATSAATTPATSSPTGTNAPRPSPNEEQGGMSLGVKIGIWIGAVAGVAIVVILATFFFLRYRQKNGKGSKNRQPQHSKSMSLVEMDGNESKETIVMELPGSDLPGAVETSMGKRVEMD